MKNIILILDNAIWHKSGKSKWYHIQPIFLPPYSPDFNPIERFWFRFKKDFFPISLQNHERNFIIEFVE